MEEMKMRNMVDGLHTHMGKRIIKPLAVALSGVWRGLEGRDGGAI
jgi:hypothetical protein